MNHFAPEFFLQPTEQIARALLGALLVHETPEGRVSGFISETEAYLGVRDPASHAFRGETKRNAAMFGPGGHAYIYFIYGNHFCINVTTQKQGVGEGVLIRGIIPYEGIELMRQRRGNRPDKDLTNGPGKVCQAMGIGPEMYGHDFSQPPLQLFMAPADLSPLKTHEIVVTPRIGISQAVDLPLRFVLKPIDL